jgi:hypothetical protein
VARAHEGKPKARDWDAHGLPVTHPPVTLSRLDGRKRYKVSELNFVDRRASTWAGAGEKEKNPLFDDMTTHWPGGVYTRSQLHDELQTMTSSGMFEQVNLQGKPKPDGTLALTVTYAESVWPGIDYQFHDKLDNFVEGNTNIAVIDRELPQQVYTGV